MNSIVFGMHTIPVGKQHRDCLVETPVSLVLYSTTFPLFAFSISLSLDCRSRITTTFSSVAVGFRKMSGEVRLDHLKQVNVSCTFLVCRFMRFCFLQHFRVVVTLIFQ